jgi:hypothetical protein
LRDPEIASNIAMTRVVKDPDDFSDWVNARGCPLRRRQEIKVASEY